MSPTHPSLLSQDPCFAVGVAFQSFNQSMIHRTSFSADVHKGGTSAVRRFRNHCSSRCQANSSSTACSAVMKRPSKAEAKRGRGARLDQGSGTARGTANVAPPCPRNRLSQGDAEVVLEAR